MIFAADLMIPVATYFHGLRVCPGVVDARRNGECMNLQAQPPVLVSSLVSYSESVPRDLYEPDAIFSPQSRRREIRLDH
jgi:hypothetical protein